MPILQRFSAALCPLYYIFLYLFLVYFFGIAARTFTITVGGRRPPVSKSDIWIFRRCQAALGLSLWFQMLDSARAPAAHNCQAHREGVSFLFGILNISKLQLWDGCRGIATTGHGCDGVHDEKNMSDSGVVCEKAPFWGEGSLSGAWHSCERERDSGQDK